MRKKHQPGCPCCESDDPGECTCGTNIQIEIYNAEDEAYVIQLYGFAGIPPEPYCCELSITGFSDINGTYLIDVSGTPDYSDLDYEYFLLNVVPALENPINIRSISCPALIVPQYQCYWIMALYRKAITTDVGTYDACTGNVVFVVLKQEQDTLPPDPPEDCDYNLAWNFNNIFGGPYSSNPEVDYDRCEGALNVLAEIYSATGWALPPEEPCIHRIWTASYDIGPGT